MRKSKRFCAMDIHKDSITVAIAEGGKAPLLYGTIESTGAAVARLAGKLSDSGAPLRFCYEAGPCGYGVYRQLRALGHECAVVAPSLIPRRPGDRIKTDRRDVLSLARLHRHGELTAVWVPDEEQEAIRDLERAREDFKHAERRVRQRLTGFLLRHDRNYTGGRRWTQAHYRWLEAQSFDHPVQQIVLQEYVDEIQHAGARIKALEKELEQALSDWTFAGEAQDLRALRGWTRSPRSRSWPNWETSHASTRRASSWPMSAWRPASTPAASAENGGRLPRRATRTCGGSWWSRPSAIVSRRVRPGTCSAAPNAPRPRWKAQKRLCGRYRRLSARGMPKGKVCTAIARELLGFIWAIVWERRHPGSMVARVA